MGHLVDDGFARFVGAMARRRRVMPAVDKGSRKGNTVKRWLIALLAAVAGSALVAGPVRAAASETEPNNQPSSADNVAPNLWRKGVTTPNDTDWFWRYGFTGRMRVQVINWGPSPIKVRWYNYNLRGWSDYIQYTNTWTASVGGNPQHQYYFWVHALNWPGARYSIIVQNH